MLRRFSIECPNCSEPGPVDADLEGGLATIECIHCRRPYMVEVKWTAKITIYKMQVVEVQVDPVMDPGQNSHLVETILATAEVLARPAEPKLRMADREGETRVDALKDGSEPVRQVLARCAHHGGIGQPDDRCRMTRWIEITQAVMIWHCHHHEPKT